MLNTQLKMNEVETSAKQNSSSELDEGAPFLASEEGHLVRSETSDRQDASSRIPSFKLSTPGYSKVSFINEKKKDEKVEDNLAKRADQSSSIFGQQYKLNIKGPPRPPLPARHAKQNLKNYESDTVSNSRIPNTGSLRRKKEINHEPMSPNRFMERPTQHHTFITDPADVRQIETGLLHLMEEFHIGNLRAFGKDSRLRQMEEIREQQERLARLHFEIGVQQEQYAPLSEEGLRISEENMHKVMEKLAQLSESIENLHTNYHDKKTNLYSSSEVDTSKTESSKFCHSSPQQTSMTSSASGDTLLPTSSRPESQSQLHKEVPVSPHNATKISKSLSVPKPSDDK